MRYFVTIAYEPSIWSDASPEVQERYHAEHACANSREDPP